MNTRPIYHWLRLSSCATLLAFIPALAPAATPPPPVAPSETLPADDAPADSFPAIGETVLPPPPTPFPPSNGPLPPGPGAGIGPAWVPLGPGPTTRGQVENVSPDNEVVGAIETLAAHPTDPDILYAGAVNGGIWKTYNATAASPDWQPLTDYQASLSVGALQFDPADTETLLAGIGRFSSLSQQGGALTGLLLTHDGGATWTPINDPLLQGQNISGVMIEGSLLLASASPFLSAGGGGLLRSTDGGLGWTKVSGANGLPSGGIFDLVAIPNGDIYVSVAKTGIFRSADGGLTWGNISSGDPTLDAMITDPDNNNTEMALAADGRLYSAVLIKGRAQYIGYTDDGGATWTAMDLPQTLEDGTNVEGLNPREKPGGQGSIHFSIRVDPNDPKLIYIAGDRQPAPFPNFIGAFNFSGRLFRGDTTVAPTGAIPSPQWQHLTHSNAIAAIPGGGTANKSSPHADSREMVFDAGGTLVEVDDGGIYRRTSPRDNSGDWFSINGDIQTTEFHSIAYDSLSNIVIGGAQDTGTPQQISTGSTTWISVSTADGGVVAVDDTSLAGQSIRYSSFQVFQDFRRQTYDAANGFVSQHSPSLIVAGSGGQSLPQIDSNIQFYQPYVLNKINPVRGILGTANLYESLDRFDNLTDVSGFMGTFITAMAYGGRRGGIDNPDVIYFGTHESYGPGAMVQLRTSSGGTFTNLVDYPGGTPRGIALDPDDWHSAYVVDGNKVFVTTDAGGSWSEVTGNLADPGLWSIAYIPAARDSIVVGNRGGVFRMMTDTPGVWVKFGMDLPQAPVFDLDYDADDDVLVAGTLGRGAWMLSDVTVPVGADLSILKTDSADPIMAGNTLVYTLTVNNAGPADAQAVQVDDTMPAGVDFVATNGCGNDPAGIPTCNLGDLAAGGSTQFTITATVQKATIGIITNSATVSAATDDPAPGDNDTSIDTTVMEYGDIDLDGCIGRSDVRLVVNGVRSGNTEPSWDFNNDGVITRADGRALVQHYTNPRGVCP